MIVKISNVKRAGHQSQEDVGIGDEEAAAAAAAALPVEDTETIRAG